MLLARALADSWARAEEDLLALHTKLGIASNSYCPLGTPDLHKWNVSVATDPTLTSIAKATGTSNYQVTLRWQLQKGCVGLSRVAVHACVDPPCPPGTHTHTLAHIYTHTHTHTHTHHHHHPPRALFA